MDVLPKIAGQLVSIRQLCESDFDDWVLATKSEEFRLMCGMESEPTDQENEDRFAELLRQEHSYNFAVMRMEDAQYLGDCRLHKIDQNEKKARLAIGLIEDYFDCGYGSDAVRCLLDFGFRVLGLNSIELRVVSFNKRAIECYRKCGFSQVEVLKGVVKIGGKFYDDVIMSAESEG